MPTVELVYFPGCPNVPAAREQLRRALAATGLPVRWTELDVTDPSVPAHARGYGSPTILVAGNDVAGEAPEHGSACRLYPESDLTGAPSLLDIVRALRLATR